MAVPGGPNAGSLQFAVSGDQIRKLKTALQSLGKIGSELLVEGVPERMVLRAINSSKSAFMAVTFSARFFDSYAVLRATVVQAGVLLKHVLAAFRSQKIARMSFELTPDARLSISLECLNGLNKRYCLNAVEADILHASMDKDACATTAVAEARELDKLLGSFQASLDEITIMALPAADAAPAGGARSELAGHTGIPSGGLGRAAGAGAQVRIQSFVDPAKGAAEGALHTRLDVDTAGLFLSYSHASPHASDATFNLKDLRALLGLCEAMGAEITLRFDGAGAPLHAEPHFRGAGGAVQYSLLDRRPALGPMAAHCASAGTALLPYGVLAGGFLTDKYAGVDVRAVRADTYSKSKYSSVLVESVGGWDGLQRLLAGLKPIAAKHGTTTANVAARWVLQQPLVPAVIVGARNAEHVADHRALFTFALDGDDLDAIGALLERAKRPKGDCYTWERGGEF